jgi:type II secretory pathway component PulJ
MNDGLMIAITGAIGSLGTIIVQKAFSRKRDAVDYQTDLIENLWKEIGRLQEQITQLQKREKEAEDTETRLTKRIEELELTNKKQAIEITNLKEKLKNVESKKS